MLSEFVIVFLPMRKCLLISWMQSPSVVILEPKEIKSATVSIFSPSICHEVMGLDAMIFVFCMLSFNSPFSPISFTFIKRLFSSTLPPAIRVVSSAYMRLFIFLPAILIPTCDSSRKAFHMMYSASKSNKPYLFLQFSRSFMSDSLWPHGLQHARLPCPSLEFNNSETSK